MFDKLFRQKTDDVLIQLLRYTFVGGLAFVVDYGSLYMLTEHAGMYYLHSAAIAFLIGLTANYFLSVSWVFQRRTIRNQLLEFSVFGFLGFLGFVWTLLLMYMLTEWVGNHYLLSKGITTGAVFLWNFGSRKLLLFRYHSAQNLNPHPVECAHAPEEACTAVESGKTAIHPKETF